MSHKYVVHNDKGDVVGVGEVIENVQSIGKGVEIIQKVISGVGAKEGNQVEIDEETFTELNQPDKDFKDFKVSKGKVDRLEKHT